MLCFILLALSAFCGVKEMPDGKPYWRFPVDNDYNAPKIRFDAVDVNGDVLRSYAVALAKDGKGDWQPSEDVRVWNGRRISLRLVSAPDGAVSWLDGITASDVPFLPAADDPERLQFHFMPPSGYMNDPNGLVYRDGEWVMMFQHAPFACSNPWGGCQNWGHAVSTNLVDWHYLGTAARPYPGNVALISGSGVVDVDNTAGFGKGSHVLCVVGKTPKGDGLLLFSSTDGRSYKPYEGNPVFSRPGLGGDPKVIWYAPTRRWIMATFGSQDNCYAMNFCSSPDLHHWQYESTYCGDHRSKGVQHFLYECPGIEELKIECETNTAWVVWSADMEYAVGTFDGHAFTRLEGHEPLRSLASADRCPYYAAQTFQNAPDGRVVLLPWYRIAPPHARTYNQAMGLPVELKLRRTNAGLRMVRYPVRELEVLRVGGSVPFARFEGELAEMRVSAELAEDGVLEMDLRGVKVSYDARHERLSCGNESVYWPLVRNLLDIRMFLDRTGLECFSSDGLLCWPFCEAHPVPGNGRLSSVTSGGVKDLDCRAWKLRRGESRCR